MKTREKTFVSVVIYVHNAENRIGSFLKTIISQLEENFEYSEIICVNDYSDDDSVRIIRETSLKAKNTSISILNMSYFHGLEIAMNAGVALSIGDFVFEFDSTIMDYDSKEIMRVYRHSLSGFDIVSASPNRKQKFSSSMFYAMFDKFTDISYKMSTESFRILSRRVINRISSMNKTVPYRKAVYSNCGLKVDTLVYEVIPVNATIDKKERKYRQSLAADSLILFTDVGYKFSAMMTLLMICMTVFMAVYSVAVYCIGSPVEGWTTTILFLSVAFFGLFAILTVVIKYLQILVELIFKRTRYCFESIEKLTK